MKQIAKQKTRCLIPTITALMLVLGLLAALFAPGITGKPAQASASEPVQPAAYGNVISVAAGTFHTVAVTAAGKVFTFGYNNYGQLGDGTTAHKNTPQDITGRFGLAGGEKVISVAAGTYHTAALTDGGRIFTFGYNNRGQLGDGTAADKNTPQNIRGRFDLAVGEKIISVAAGDVHTAAVTDGGRIFTFGYNGCGQLGDGTTADKHTPQDITAGFGLADGEKVISVAAGAHHTTAVTDGGRIFTFGHNICGQLGDGANADKNTPQDITGRFGLAGGEKVISVAAGLSHTVAVTDGGRIFTFGYNDGGQLGDGTYADKNTPQDLTAGFGLADGEKVISVAAGAHHTAAVTDGGKIFTFGYNSDGQLGDGTTADKHTPQEITGSFNFTDGEKIISVTAGSNHTFALTNRGSLLACGFNLYGQCGSNKAGFLNTPQQALLGEALLIAAGSLHTAAVTDGGRIFTFGYNSDSQLGDGTNADKNTPQDITGRFELADGEKIISVAAGALHTAAVTEGGRIFTFGYNGGGQLGDGTDADKNTPQDITARFGLESGEKVISVAAGAYHTAALTDGGRIFTFGYNNRGQLGDGTNADKNTPQDITGRFGLADGEKIISVAAGVLHTAVVTDGGRIFTFGFNGGGQLGDGTTADKHTPQDITAGFGLADGEKVISVAAGESHTAAVTDGGKIFTFGYNSDGQLGDGTNADKHTPQDITGRFGLANGEKVISVAAGLSHTAVVTDGGKIFTFGDNDGGQLGDGTYADKNIPQDITAGFGLADGEKVISVAAGFSHTAAVTDGGKIFTFGYNGYGQLGVGVFAYLTEFKVAIKMGEQTIAALGAATLTKTVGDAAFSVSVTGGAGAGALTYESSDNAVATVDSGGSVTIAGAGSANITVKKAGDIDYEDSNTVIFTLTVAQAQGSGTLSMNGWTYGGAASSPSLTGVNYAYAAPVYEYKAKGADDSTYTAVKPSDAGEYTVRASFAATTNYAAFTLTADFTIEAAQGGGNDGLSPGAIAGITIGSVAFVSIGGFAIFWFVIKKKKFADLVKVFKKSKPQK